MILFFNLGLGIKAIPTERIYSITQTHEIIHVVYDEGSLEVDSNGNYVTKIEEFSVHYRNVGFAIKDMYNFYKALKNNIQTYNFSSDIVEMNLKKI